MDLNLYAQIKGSNSIEFSFSRITIVLTIPIYAVAAKQQGLVGLGAPSLNLLHEASWLGTCRFTCHSCTCTSPFFRNIYWYRWEPLLNFHFFDPNNWLIYYYMSRHMDSWTQKLAIFNQTSRIKYYSSIFFSNRKWWAVSICLGSRTATAQQVYRYATSRD
jgi:hypothetical protein